MGITLFDSRHSTNTHNVLRYNRRIESYKCEINDDKDGKMFSVEEYNNEVEAKVLRHSASVFHEALADGEKYYHVQGDGIAYDIIYKGNTEWFGDLIPAYIGKIVPEYLSYDEEDVSSLDIDYLNSSSKYIILKVNEYSVAVARAVLRYTDKPVYFMDPRALWFLDKCDNLHIGEMPEEDEKTVYLVGALGKGYAKGDKQVNKRSDIFAFNSLYLLQYMLDGRKMEQIKYLEYPLAKSPMGIGGLLIQTAYILSFAESLGLKICYDGDVIGKFKISDLSKYFKLDFKRSDSTPENTVSIGSIAFLNILWRYYVSPGRLSTNVLQDKFLNDLDEYTEAIIKGRKSLGVLIRGTDYKTVGFVGARAQASVDDMLPMIKEWMEQGGYEVIFLATEDKDVLDQMRKEFGNKVVAIAQERHSVKDFEKGQIINELEKQLYTEDEYDARVIDTTINYYYALHLLSSCDAFMCSGHNNGWDTVNAMNDGRFERVYKFQIDAGLTF